MKAVHPYLYFNGNTEEAFNFYKSVFGGNFVDIIRFSDFEENVMGVSKEEQNKIAHIGLSLANGVLLMGTDIVRSMGKTLNVGNNFYITIEPESEQEASQLFEALSAGGHVNMPLQKTDWAAKHGSCTDKYGIQWMVDYAGDV